MESKNVVGLTIAITVGLIMTAFLLVPIVKDGANAGAEKWSNGSEYMAYAGTDTVEMIVSNENVIVSDGNTINGSGYYAVVTDTMYLAINNLNLNVFYYVEGSQGWSSLNGANVTIDGAAKTVTLSDITHASSNDNIVGDTLVVPYSEFCLYRVATGNFVGVPYADIGDVKVNNDDLRAIVYIHANGVYTWDGTDVYLNGTLSETPGTVTLVGTSDPELYTLSAVSYGESVVASYVYVPAVVYGESAVDDNTSSLLLIIPVMVILALLMLAVKVVVGRNEE